MAASAPKRPQSLTGREMLAVHEVAAWLTVSIRTVYRLVAAGKFPPGIHFRSRTVRWRACDVEAYLATAEAQVWSRSLRAN